MQTRVPDCLNKLQHRITGHVIIYFAFVGLINVLADDWMTFLFQMLPNLMKAPNVSLAFQELKAAELLLDFKNGTGRQLIVGDMASTQRNANNSLNTTETPSGHGQVLFDQARPELEVAVHRQTFCRQTNPRGTKVKTVYQPGSW